MLQEALRAYVLADTGAQNQAESTVRLVVTHSNLQASFMDIRLDLHVRHGMSWRPSAAEVECLAWMPMACLLACCSDSRGDHACQSCR